MTDYAVCPYCEEPLAADVCSTCEVIFPAVPDTNHHGHHGGLGQRFLIASVPAAVLALFVESTLYGYVLYLGVYLTYCAWGEATRVPASRGQSATEWQPSALTASS